MKKLLLLSGIIATACADDPCFEDGTCIDETDQAISTVISSGLKNGKLADFEIIGNDVYYTQQEAVSCAVSDDYARIAKVPKSGGAATDVYVATGCGGTQFQPQDLLTDGTNLFVADVRNGRVLKMNLSGTVSATLTGFTFSTSPHQQRLAYDATNAILYVADDLKVWKSTSGGTVTPAELMDPANPVKNLAIDSSYIYVSHADKIDRVTPAGVVTSGWVDVPTSIDAMKLVGTDLFYAESGNFKVHKIVTTTSVDTVIYDSAANVRRATSLTFDPASGKLFDVDFDIAGANDHDLMRHLSSSSWARTEQLAAQDMEGAGNLTINNGSKLFWFSNGATSRGIFSENLTSL
jgi:hypothetical protein